MDNLCALFFYYVEMIEKATKTLPNPKWKKME